MSAGSTLRARYRGALLGLAVGDALGTTLEFRPPGSFTPITDMVGGGPFGLPRGAFTDDTSMALCLADSLLACRGFDAADQVSRYLRWYREGYRSSTGRCFDIGNTVRAALERFAASGEPMAGDSAPSQGGNGSLMRLAPLPMAYARDPRRAVALAGTMSRTTHAAPEPVDACRYYAGLLVGALAGVPRATLLSPRYHPLGAWPPGALAARIDAVAAGSFRHRQPPTIRGTGYVVDALEAALWAFAHHEDFAAGALAAVNLGDDADTTGAIYGQLAGACHGEDAIPAHWRDCLFQADEIGGLAEELLALAASLEGDSP